jgi:hypothetical protein
MSEPTIKELENMIKEIELILKKQGAITDARLESHLDNLNQLHISRIKEGIKK